MGYARICFAADVLPIALFLMPSTYKLIGSEKSGGDGEITLIFASEDVADGKIINVAPIVRDAGSTRSITIEPVG